MVSLLGPAEVRSVAAVTVMLSGSGPTIAVIAWTRIAGTHVVELSGP